MKKNLNIFFIFSIFSIYAQNSNNQIKVTYGFLNQSTEIKNDKNYKKEAVNAFEEAYKIAEDIISFELIQNNNETIFLKNKLVLQESYSPLVQITLRVTGKNDFYKNENKFYNVFQDFGETYLILVNPLKNLEITSESKSINNYTCYKATCYDEFTKQNVSLWFTPDLNYHIGPFNFHNLPGLVMEVNYKYYSIVCKNIKFEVDQNDIDKIKKPKGLEITHNEMIKRFEMSKNNLRKSKN
jgi:GLPGLI family protein